MTRKRIKKKCQDCTSWGSWSRRWR